MLTPDNSDLSRLPPSRKVEGYSSHGSPSPIGYRGKHKPTDKDFKKIMNDESQQGDEEEINIADNLKNGSAMSLFSPSKKTGKTQDPNVTSPPTEKKGPLKHRRASSSSSAEVPLQPAHIADQSSDTSPAVKLPLFKRSDDSQDKKTADSQSQIAKTDDKAKSADEDEAVFFSGRSTDIDEDLPLISQSDDLPEEEILEDALLADNTAISPANKLKALQKKSTITPNEGKQADTSKEIDVTAASEGPASPLAVYKQMSSKGNSKLFAMGESAETVSPSKKESRRTEKSTTRFNEAQSDIASINALGTYIAPPNVVGESASNVAPMPKAHLQAIVDQIVDKLYTVQAAGQTNTIIVLKHPPIFEGANVVVTSFNSATKEFNLSFENLRPDAKLLLDNNVNALKQALEDKGFANAVHQITTTTEIEHRIPTETESQPFSGGGDKEHSERNFSGEEQDEE